MKRKIFFFLLVIMIISLPLQAQEVGDFLETREGREVIVLGEDEAIEFMMADGVFRDPFQDYRPSADIATPADEIVLPDEVPFVLRGIISYEGRKAALLSGPDISRIALEGDVVRDYRVTGIYDENDLITLNYEGETIRMRIGGDIIDRQDQ